MSRRFAAPLILLLLVSGCAAPPLPPPTAAHPASPSAAEAPLPPNRYILDEPRAVSINASPTTTEAR